MQIELITQTSCQPHHALLNSICTGNVEGSLEYIVISDTTSTATGIEMNGYNKGYNKHKKKIKHLANLHNVTPLIKRT